MVAATVCYFLLLFTFLAQQGNNLSKIPKLISATSLILSLPALLREVALL